MALSLTIDLPDPEATDQLGRHLAAQLRPGDTLLLAGQIGAGKSHLARAIIRAVAGADIDVPSPTYTLVQTYETGRGTLWHADLYRLGDLSEIAELGLDDAFGRDIALVEWPEMLDAPIDALVITFEIQGEGRRLGLSCDGHRWDDLSRAELRCHG